MTRAYHPVPAAPRAGVSAVAGSCPPASPLLAESWLLAWNQINGAVSIGVDATLHPWFHPEIGCADTDCATTLLAELMETPGLPAAVRIVIAGSLKPKRRRSQWRGR